MTHEMLMLLLLGAGNGLMHALDADHIVAVSTVAVGEGGSRRRIFRTALEWGVGHGASLLMISLVVLGFGLALPERLSHMAEILVGVMLVGIGLSLGWALFRGKLQLTAHQHRALPPHLHLHGHKHPKLGDHKSMLVGLIHGAAGSAPLLAILPLVIKSQFIYAALYILVFTFFVALMMCIFGGVLGTILQRCQQRYQRSIALFQGVLALQSMVFGIFWIAKAV